MIKRLIASTKILLLTITAIVLAGAHAHASMLEVIVLDPSGEPVPDVVVYVMQSGIAASSMAAPGKEIIDQRDTRFVPHILVVQAGTAVEFPNSDVVAHHVYSFSKPNNFVLPLYKGDAYDPVTFVHDGIVTLGCNIHDHMLAFVVVVNTDVFGKTDENGKLTLEIDDLATGHTVNIWSPRIRDKSLVQTLLNSDSDKSVITFALQKSLRPRHDTGLDGFQWSDY